MWHGACQQLVIWLAASREWTPSSLISTDQWSVNNPWNALFLFTGSHIAHLLAHTPTHLGLLPTQSLTNLHAHLLACPLICCFLAHQLITCSHTHALTCSTLAYPLCTHSLTTCTHSFLDMSTNSLRSTIGMWRTKLVKVMRWVITHSTHTMNILLLYRKHTSLLFDPTREFIIMK